MSRSNAYMRKLAAPDSDPRILPPPPPPLLPLGMASSNHVILGDGKAIENGSSPL